MLSDSLIQDLENSCICGIDFNSEHIKWDFPGGPVVKNLPYNAGDAGSIPGQGTKIPHATGQLSPRATATELVCHKLQSSNALEPAHHN